MEILVPVLCIVGFIIAVYWLLLPFLLIKRLDKILDSTDRLNASLDTLAKGIEQYVNGLKPKEGR